jgi:hypothetical protein
LLTEEREEHVQASDFNIFIFFIMSAEPMSADSRAGVDAAADRQR